VPANSFHHLKDQIVKRGIISALFIVAGLLGCAKQVHPLTLAEIPPAIRKAFQSAPAEIQKTSNSIITQVEHKQYAPATMQIQALMEAPELSKEQRDIIARSLMTLNENLQKQIQAQEAAVAATPDNTPNRPSPVVEKAKTPDPSSAEAEAALNYYKRTK
jgi:hypothetical protein